ncbi:MAG: undecaprenyl-diphosphate phosphatase [Planctomycetes bacterium]|nr:undecaprenyl-diphosphate phosphatase [Planctomycetota bacterium]
MSVAADAAGLGLPQAALLGLVEGITEYLPVSSTGHLILAQRALGIGNDEASRAFAICIQAGAILAVLGVYAPRVVWMLRGFAGGDAGGRKLALQLVVAFLPAAVVGVLFKKHIEHSLFGLWPVVWAWALGGAAILLVPVLRRGVQGSQGRALLDLSYGTAFAIGLFQCLALLPGTSRSLATIGGALLLGLSGAAAVEFSLLLGVLTLCAATVKEAHDAGGAMLEHYGAAPIVVGALVAAVSAWLAVRWLVNWLQTRGLAPFGWYRLVLAATVGVLLARGLLPAG